MDSIEKPSLYNYEKDGNNDKYKEDENSEAPPSIIQSQFSINPNSQINIEISSQNNIIPENNRINDNSDPNENKLKSSPNIKNAYPKESINNITNNNIEPEQNNFNSNQENNQAQSYQNNPNFPQSFNHLEPPHDLNPQPQYNEEGYGTTDPIPSGEYQNFPYNPQEYYAPHFSHGYHRPHFWMHGPPPHDEQFWMHGPPPFGPHGDPFWMHGPPPHGPHGGHFWMHGPPPHGPHGEHFGHHGCHHGPPHFHGHH